MGFTWYGGLIGGIVASLVIVRRHQLPLGLVSGANLWAIVSLLTGVVLIVRTQFLNRSRRRTAVQAANTEEVMTARSAT